MKYISIISHIAHQNKTKAHFRGHIVSLYAFTRSAAAMDHIIASPQKYKSGQLKYSHAYLLRTDKERIETITQDTKAFWLTA